jgi:hypothetical protein
MKTQKQKEPLTSGYCYVCGIVVQIDQDDTSHRGYRCSQCDWPNVIRVPRGSEELFTVVFRELKRMREKEKKCPTQKK